MKSSPLARSGGFATVLGGLLWLGGALVFYVFTHGSTGTDRLGTLAGLDGTDYGRMGVAWPALLLAGLAALRAEYGDRLGRLGRNGLRTSSGALTMQLASVVMQWWLKDGHVAEDFESVTLTLGFYLGAVSYFVLAVGMTMLGIASLRRKALGWASPVPLAIGLLVLPTLLFDFSHLSTGTPTWDLIYAASKLPLSLCWMLLGCRLWTAGEVRAESWPMPAAGRPAS